MGDLKEIRESFTETLQGRFHLRVKYPGNNELMEEADEETPQLSEVPTPLLSTPGESTPPIEENGSGNGNGKSESVPTQKLNPISSESES